MKTSIILTSIFFIIFTALLGDDKSINNIELGKLLEKADSLFNSRQFQQSREVYKQAAKLAENSQDNSSLTETYSMIARTFLTLDKKEIGRKWIYKAQSIANIEEPSGWSRYLGVRGRFEWRDNELDKAQITFTEMYEFCSTQKLHERAIDAARMMAIVSDLEGQVLWGKKGIAEAEAGNVRRLLGSLWNNLAATYEDMGQYKDAVLAYLKARDYHYEFGDETTKMIANWALGHAFRLNDDIPNAIKWMTPVLPSAIKLNNIEFIGWTHDELGEIELIKENNKTALEHFTKAAEYLKEADMPNWDPDGYQKQLEKIKKTELLINSND
ncbi:MAG: hypothetical protein GY865_12530 [candidate division Zixibacteria bacterium]|nr:hypothetical protein [candidate division Zixibacteria bacterium]